MNNPYSAKAHDFIRNKILSGEFYPGYRLVNKELTKILGVSVTPIRDALHQLESEGLVEIFPRVGAQVKTFDLVSFKELSELRCAFECLAAELAAANRTRAELAIVEGSLNEMGEILKASAEGFTTEKRDLLRTADIRFHVAIMTAAHNRKLYDEVLRLQVIHRLNSPSARGKLQPEADLVNWQNSVFESHRRIFEAIRDHDQEGARRAMREHIQDIIDRAVLAMAKSLQSGSFSQVASNTFGYIE